MKWSSIAVTGVCAGVYLFFTVYLFIYGYGRPDPNACYFVSGLDQPEKTRDAAIEAAKAANIEVKKGYPINMGHLFRVWFIWGFWSQVFFISITTIYVVLRKFTKANRSITNSIQAIL